MKERRAWRLDLAAALLFVAGTLAGMAVFSHDPADLPGAIYPPPPRPANLLGQPGAALAMALVQALGVGVFALLVAWIDLVLLLLVRKNWARWTRRLIGFLLLVPTLAVLACRWGLVWNAAGVAGPGGFLGAWLDAWLEELLPSTAGMIVLATTAALGVGLGCDFLLWRLVAGLFWLLRLVSRVLSWLARLSIRVGGQEPAVGPDEPVAAKPAVPDPAPPETRAGDIPITYHDSTSGDDADGPCEPLVDKRRSVSSHGLHSERERFAGYEVPPLTLLEDSAPAARTDQEQQLRERAVLLEKTIRDFGFNVKVVGISTGPVVTLYEVGLETGLRVHKITSLADDLALRLRVPGVRIVAPLPGKNAIGIEIPNEHRDIVRIKEVIQTAGPRLARMKIPVFLGKNAEGKALIGDLADMPHLLIAGATGTGKSVCLTTTILSVLMTRRPDEVRLVLIDPKSGVEMQGWSRVPHLMSPIIEDMKKAEAVLAWAVDKMEERYDLLRRARVRNIAGYNQLGADEVLRRIKPDEDERQRIPEQMSYIVIVIDEMSDLMMQFKKEVEGYIIRLAQKSRAAGIHLVLATQKPTVDVITGLIKSNLPSRICFKVAQKSDSRVVLDQMGADKLLGQGDLLYLAPGTSDLVRAQGAYASETEIEKVADYLESDPCYDTELLQLKTREMREAEEAGDSLLERVKNRDKLYEQAVEVIIREGRGSVSLLQRSLGIGYGRAARLIDFMAQDGIVGQYNGSNAREVLYTPEQWDDLKGSQAEAVA
jgi:S-DNA-T family DNA segregation ATPase FtsK/SpoIIIE